MERTFLKFRQGFLNTQTQLLHNFTRIKLLEYRRQKIYSAKECSSCDHHKIRKK